MDKLAITAIILAGGKSSRMGTDKALLEVNGKTLLQQVCEAASGCCSKILIITPWIDRYLHLPLPSISEFVLEQNTTTPIQAFHLGAEKIRNNSQVQWILLLACDLANLNSDTITEWSENLPELPSQSQAYLAVCDRTFFKSSTKSSIKSSNNSPSSSPSSSPSKKAWEPLCGFYRIGCYQSLTRFLQEDSTYSFQDWLSELDVSIIGSVSERMLFNCNSPADWDQILFQNSEEIKIKGDRYDSSSPN
jgi:molybdenum cofactor guanylyltransferase